MRIGCSTGSLSAISVVSFAIAFATSCSNNPATDRTTFNPGAGGAAGAQAAGGGAGTNTGGSVPSYGGSTGLAGSFIGTDADLSGGLDTGTADAGYAAPLDVTWIQATIGRFALGKEIGGAAVADTGIAVTDQACNQIAGVVRDFKGYGPPEEGHPDFETCIGSSATKGMVSADLGSDSKPVYVAVCEPAMITDTVACPNGQEQSTEANFKQWYRFTQDVNRPFLIYFEFAPNPQKPGVMTFQSNSFYPLDGQGFGNAGRNHNFHFTTEIHTKFKYSGGEVFTFTGDDDVWIYINGKRVMDLGGSHSSVSETLTLDTIAATIGIEKGKTYNFDMFHAERHTPNSNFRVDTSFEFVDCGYVPIEIY